MPNPHQLIGRGLRRGLIPARSRQCTKKWHTVWARQHHHEAGGARRSRSTRSTELSTGMPCVDSSKALDAMRRAQAAGPHGQPVLRKRSRRMAKQMWLGLLGSLIAVIVANTPAAAQQQQKPNILFIMGDDIGWMQPSIYHQGLMVGETPNIDRIGQEGAKFMDYVAMQSCTSGRNAFFTGMYPLRTRLIPPELPGSPAYLRPGTPALAKFLLDLCYNTGEFGKNHLGDHTAALPTAHGFQEYWGYLYHLDAMQQVSFPDMNKNPTTQTVAPPCKNMPIPGVPEVPGAVDPKTTICLTPPRPVLWCKSSDGTEKNQNCQDEGPLTLERSKTVDEEISAKVIDFLD